MLRIVCSDDLKEFVLAQGWNLERVKRVFRHGQVTAIRHPTAGVQTRYYDVLLDRDGTDLPDAVVNFLRNRAEVVYVAEWTPGSADPELAAGKVWKGADPAIHRFAGWPV